MLEFARANAKAVLDARIKLHRDRNRDFTQRLIACVNTPLKYFRSSNGPITHWAFIGFKGEQKMDLWKKYRLPLKTVGFHPLPSFHNLMSFSLSPVRQTISQVFARFYDLCCSLFFCKLHFCANLLRIFQVFG
jgi:hypothetical protein